MNLRKLKNTATEAGSGKQANPSVIPRGIKQDINNSCSAFH